MAPRAPFAGFAVRFLAEKACSATIMAWFLAREAPLTAHKPSSASQTMLPQRFLASLAAAEASLPVDQASLTVDQASLTVDQASLTVWKPCWVSSEASLSVARAMVMVVEASLAVEKASFLVKEASWSVWKLA
jgi:hypothetical protein